MTTSGTGASPRVVALVGPYLSGKTTLLESILCVTGAAHRSAAAGRLVGDGSPESKAREMGTELNVASCTFLGDTYTFLDCPGAVDLMQETRNALLGADVAVVVTEPETDKILALAPLMHELDTAGIPHMVFINKMDRASGRVRDLVATLADISTKPVVLRHVPIRNGDAVTGYVDLASERAYLYRREGGSEIIDKPGEIEERVAEARYTMLETLADFDDHLMEELLEDIDPPADEVYQDLARDLREGLIVPVFLGEAQADHGTTRLMKALRHEIPSFDATCARIGADTAGPGPLAQVLKTVHAPHTGKLSVARVYRGRIAEGDSLNGDRVAGVYRLFGDKTEKLAKAGPGDVVAFGRMDGIKTGDTLTAGSGEALPRADGIDPVFGMAMTVDSRKDEAKLSMAMSRLTEEDPGLKVEHREDTGELVLLGQGEMHLRLAIDRLASKYGLAASTHLPQVPYRETIRSGKKQHSRFKKQTGGHGQFGDVVVEIKPLPAGSGFEFDQTIHGGSIPKQYIPSVEAGVKEYLDRGPLGFPVVDVGVTLTDGSYHTVDSSDLAFKTAGRMAMAEALPECNPVLLEPIEYVEIVSPSSYTSKINGLISSRRGQILGFDAREGWSGWDRVEAHIPQAEMHDLIVELRSITQGAGTFTHKYHHLNELTGSLREKVLAKRKEQLTRPN